ncbi:hypothetical protein RYX36_006212, partial [Vicia faba]
MSSFNVEKQESVDSMRNSDNGSCIFHAEIETYSNFSNDADKHGNLGNDVKSNSGNGSTNDISSTYNDIHVDQVVDEINKLNINHPEGIHIPSNSTNSFVHSSNGFVFGGNDNVSSCFSASSGSNARSLQLHTNDNFDNIGGQYTEDGRISDVQNNTVHGITRDAAAAGITCPKTEEYLVLRSIPNVAKFHIFKHLKMPKIDKNIENLPIQIDSAILQKNLHKPLLSSLPFIVTHKKASLSRLKTSAKTFSITIDIYNQGASTAYDVSLSDENWPTDLFSIISSTTSKTWEKLDVGYVLSHTFELETKSKGVFSGEPAVIKLCVPTNVVLQVALSTPILPLDILADRPPEKKFEWAKRLLAKYGSLVSVISIIVMFVYLVATPSKYGKDRQKRRRSAA